MFMNHLSAPNTRAKEPEFSDAIYTHFDKFKLKENEAGDKGINPNARLIPAMIMWGCGPYIKFSF